MHIVQFSLEIKFYSYMRTPFPCFSVRAVHMRVKLCPLDLKLPQFETVFICQWYFFASASQMSVLRMQACPFFPSHHTHLILCQLAKSTLPFPFLPLNTLHVRNFQGKVSPMVSVNSPSEGYLQFTDWTLWAHHLSGRRSFWIRSNLQNREVRNTKANVSVMLCQQDFPLNCYLCTGYRQRS